MSEKTKKPSDDKFARGMRTATVAAVTAPTGGGTVDAEARTAINSIIAGAG